MRLLKFVIQNIEKHIQPGVMRLNWYALTISDFASECQKLLKSFSSIVQQIDQMKKDMDLRIDNDISCFNLFTTTKNQNDTDYQLNECQTYFLDIENKRNELVGIMLNVYQSISPMLIKLESLVEGTSTGNSQGMQSFYKQYEYKIFTALIT